ncbi:MAG: hypothetical protein IIY23_05180, partial [Erysipelotrichaceae bacterium]|nr:hypothetical protein [Erysipelotrichaceae bacterium]
MDLFKLVGSVFVETDKANESLSKTDEKAKKTGTTFGDVAKKAAGVGTAVVGASAAAVTGMVKLANNAAETADTIDKGSIRMGISTDYYQQLGYAAGQSGVEMSTLEKAAKKLEGTDLNLEDAMNEIMSLGTAAERSEKAAELFGEGVAYQMAPLLEESSESFDGLLQRANDLGIVMSEDTVKAGVTLGDTMEDLQKSFGAVATNLGGALMPVVQEFVEILLSFAPFIQQAMSDLAPMLSDLFSRLMPPLLSLIDQIWPVLQSALEVLMPIVIELAGEILPAIVDIISAILPILPPILALIEEIAPFLVDAVKLVLPLVVKFIQKLMPFFVKIVEAILPVLVELLPLVMEILEAICPILDLILDVLGFLLDIFGDLIKNTLPVIANLLKNVLTPILRAVTTVISAVGNAFRSVFDGIKNVWQNLPAFFTGIWEGIKRAFGAVGTWFKDTFSKAWQAVKDVFSKGGKVFDGIKEGIANVFHNVVNTIIRGLNAVIAAPFNAINNIFNRLRGVSILKLSPFSWLPQIGVPQIPQLAEGGQGDGGSALVGEQGPELLDLPKGATVIPLQRSSISIGIEDLNEKMENLIGIVEALLGQKIGVYINGQAL